MMKKGIIGLLIVAIQLIFATTVPAQDLPVLAPDPAIKQGVLPNGMTYYVVTNPSTKGCADFSLVQRSGTGTLPEVSQERCVAVAKEALASLPRIKSSSPQVWLASHGVTTSSEGFINVSSDATVFRFHDVILNSGPAVMDSTILLLMSIVDRISDTDDEFVKKCYSPADQAIIVAGDVNADAVISTIRSMSYMTTAYPSLPESGYEWVSSDSVAFVNVPSSQPRLAGVTVKWRLPRAPREYMNTVQPAIYEKFVNELGYVAQRRVYQDLERRGVPVADMNWSHRSSAQGPGDESFSATVYVKNEDVLYAVGSLARAFASFDAAGATLDEYKVAREMYMQDLYSVAHSPVRSNEEYVDRCVSAFLRNASLASPTEKLKLHVSRNMPDDRQLKLFNDMAAALIDGASDMAVTCSSSTSAYTEGQLENAFYAAWSDSFVNPSPLDAFYEKPSFAWAAASPKIKVKEMKVDPMSGGTMLTYTNGFRVICKKMNTDGKIYWSMAMNGGYGSMEGISAGEGAYLADYFKRCRFAGVEGETFRDMLLTDHMTLDVNVGLTATFFTGVAPKENASQVLQTLLTLSNERTPDEEAFACFMNDEEQRLDLMRHSIHARMAAIDSIMCPGYKYSKFKSPGKLTPAFAAKADAFFNWHSEKMNDGVLILVTDMDEAELKKLLLNYVGGFKTMETASRRPSLQYQPVSGWSTHLVDGETESIDVVISAAMPLTLDNFVTADIATMILEKSLASALTETGMYPKVTNSFHLAPKNRLSLMVSVGLVSEMGYASHIEHLGAVEALSIVRSSLQDLAQTNIPDQYLAACKAYQKNLFALRKSEPSYWLEAIALRYLDGKDLTSSYDAAVDAVTADKVKKLLLTLNGGSKVEYVIKQQ